MRIIPRQNLLGLLRRPTCQKARSAASASWPADSSVWRSRDIQYIKASLERGFTSSKAPRQLDYVPAPKVSRVNRLAVNDQRIGKLITLDIDGQQVTFDNLFLRDACECPRCVDPSTKQKLFQTSDISYNIKPKTYMALDDGTLVITWEGEPSEHESLYTIDFLKKYADKRWRLRNNFNDRRQILWDKNLMSNDILWIDYDGYMESDQRLFEAVRQLSLYGLVFLRGVPENEEQNAVEGIAQRIGNIKNTFYGKTWDVKSIKDSKNIAYTPYNLGLHMDLLYFESPPGLQFLHCIRNDAIGGSSIFADSFRAVQAIRMSSDLLFKSLCQFPVTFHYKNDGHHYHYTRPTVVLDNNTYLWHPRIDHVNWSPPFQAPVEADTTGQRNADFRRWVHAIKNISSSLDDPRSQLEIKLQRGECAIFMNRRVVHGRKKFDPQSGDRWLKGTYVDVDAFLSKFRVLSEKFKGSGDKNQDYEYGPS